MVSKDSYRYSLPSVSLGLSIHTLIHRVPHAADMIYSFCGAILMQLSGDGNNIQVREIHPIHFTMPLTEEQQQGRKILFELPGAIHSLHIEHIAALMGLCWSKRQLIHPTSDIPIEDEAEINAIDEGFKFFVSDKTDPNLNSNYHSQISLVLSSLRTAAVALFSNELPPNYAMCNLHYMLEFIEIPVLDDDDLSLTELPPFSTFGQHFGYIYRAAERILGPHEFSRTENDKEQNTIIPFAAMRPFLQSHQLDTKPEEVRRNQRNNVQEKSVQDMVEPPRDTQIEMFNPYEANNFISWTSSNADIDFDY